MVGVADVVRYVDDGINSVALHGIVKGIISEPREFDNLKTSDSSWAVLEVYAITCLRENIFGNLSTSTEDSVYYTPKSTVLFALKDKSKIGKLVSVYGKTKSGGVTLKRQNIDSSKFYGFIAPVFSKKGGDWVLLPNYIEELKTTRNSVVDAFLKEGYRSGIIVPESSTKLVYSFNGLAVYNYTLEEPEDGDYLNFPFTTRLCGGNKKPILDLYLGKYNKAIYLKNKYISTITSRLGRNNTKFTDFLDNMLKFNIHKKLDSNYIVPNTIKRYSDFFTYDMSYRELLLSLLSGLDLSKVSDKELVAFSLDCPYYLYILDKISFIDAERLYYLSLAMGYLLSDEEINLNSSVRDMSVILEASRGNKFNSLLNSTNKNLQRVVISDTFSKTPLSFENYNLIKSVCGTTDLYYIVKEGKDYYIPVVNLDSFSTAKRRGLIVEENGNYVDTDILGLELNLFIRLYNMSLTKQNISKDDLDEYITYADMEEQVYTTLCNLLDKCKYNFNIINLPKNSSFGYGQFQESIVNLFRYGKSVPDSLVITYNLDKPKWFLESDSDTHLTISEVKGLVESGVYFDQEVILIIEDMEYYSTEDLYSIFKLFKNQPITYAFGSSFSDNSEVGYLFSNISRIFNVYNIDFPMDYELSSALDKNLSNLNDYLLIGTDKHFKVQSVKKIDTIFYLKDLVYRTLKAGIDKDDLVVISDLQSKVLNSVDLNRSLVEIFQGTNSYIVGSRVLARRGILTTPNGEFNFEGYYVGNISSIDTEKDEYILTISEGVSLKVIGSENLSFAYVLPSYIAKLSSYTVKYVVCQDGYGKLSRENIITSLENGNSFSLIGNRFVLNNLKQDYKVYKNIFNRLGGLI